MTVHELPLSELPEPYTYEPYYTLTDIYGNVTDITEIVQRAEAAVLLGDADGDGSVTILDATTIQRYLASLSVSDTFNYAAACVSGNELSIIDATYIQRYLASMDIPYAVNEWVNG